MISIKPKWCEPIASGKKTIEVRKSKPKLETPFKCYIYMTQGDFKDLGTYSRWIYENRMRVIGEFICDSIIDGNNTAQDWEYICENSCVPCKEIYEYCGEDKTGHIKYCYGWHISDIKIYDKPKELSEFKCKVKKCINEVYYSVTQSLTRPPQSWQYIEELE